MPWRCDQGRLEYLNFDAIRREAAALNALEGIGLKSKTDELRARLPAMTGMPFSSGPNKLWRNYKRVFGMAMLATEKMGRLVCTDVCRDLADGGELAVNPDAYFAHLARRFYYPSPVFEGYKPEGRRVFPVCAILKLLAARLIAGGKPVVTIEEIGRIIIANEITGAEPLERFVELKPSRLLPGEAEMRQAREFVIFISQFSFLKWKKPMLWLDQYGSPEDTRRFIEEIATPDTSKRLPDPADELLRIGRLGNDGVKIRSILPVQMTTAEIEFAEGRQNRVTHLRYERSRKLREFFFSRSRQPFLCDMCSLHAPDRYPWLEGLLELHHLLPLSSPVRVRSDRTVLDDLVALCPNCHRATHHYYGSWLKKVRLDDFSSRQQAVECYQEAKQQIVLSN